MMNFLVSVINIAAFTLKSKVRRLFGLKPQVVSFTKNVGD